MTTLGTVSVAIDTNMKRTTRKEFLQTADQCAPILKERRIYPKAIVNFSDAADYPETITADKIENIGTYHLGKGQKVCLDFGHHQVGYVTLKLKSIGSPQDAPAYIKLKFGEIAKEMTEDSAEYDGWISRGWIQEETIHVDVLPTELKLPRRYAFRFLEIEVVDTSLKWKLQIEEVECTSVSAVDMQDVNKITYQDQLEEKIDEASLRTLQNCMQKVFEDGPKRDRRLWLGDLKLQAQVNYCTFKNYDLVKRCLYLFAGQTREDGMVSSCLFIEPEIIADDTMLMDYSMLYGSVLWEYYKAAKDRETLKELSQCAYRQMELAKIHFDDRNILIPGEGFWGFIDWTKNLDIQCAMQGVYIYCAREVQKIAEELGESEIAEKMKKEAELKKEAAIQHFYDRYRGLFVSGKERQVNYASQVWMILAGTVNESKGREILKKIIEINPDKKMVSPYMNHYFVEALIKCREYEKASEYIKYYWGGMIRHGADTFWELYNPEKPAESPYGSSIVNSYCHAWSCTPAYFYRERLK